MSQRWQGTRFDSSADSVDCDLLESCELTQDTHLVLQVNKLLLYGI